MSDRRDKKNYKSCEAGDRSKTGECKWWLTAAIAFLLVVLTVAAYEPIRHNDFINFDDPRYVTENQHIQKPIDIDSIKWAFGEAYANNWHPLTWLSHMFDYQLFALNPLGHHLTSVLFHIFNTLLLFCILKKATGTLWRSFFVAAAFAIHPLHVESAAWVAERKDVLSGFFGLLAIWAYVHYAERPGLTRYLWIAVFLALGLMCKPMLVTLPFVLLLLDYWPLNRLRTSKKSKGYSALRLTAEKIPLLTLVAASSVITFVVQQSTGAVKTWETFPLSMRIPNALVSYFGYIFKLIYPRSLALLYPHPLVSEPIWQVSLYFVCLVVVSALIIYFGRKQRYLTVGWLWYLGMLVPVIGLVQVGVQSMADRYTYLPAIGIFIMIAWGADALCRKLPWRKIALGATAAVVIAAMLICTRIQLGYWKDSVSLFERTLAVTKNNYAMHNNYGSSLCQQGSYREAIYHLNQCLQIKPHHPNANYNLGLALALTGDVEKGIEHLRHALKLDQKSDYTMANLAAVLMMREKPEDNDASEALRLAKKACEITKYQKPDFVDILAQAYSKNGNFDDAVKTSQRAVDLYLSQGKKKQAQNSAKQLNRYKARQLSPPDEE